MWTNAGFRRYGADSGRPTLASDLTYLSTGPGRQHNVDIEVSDMPHDVTLGPPQAHSRADVLGMSAKLLSH